MYLTSDWPGGDEEDRQLLIAKVWSWLNAFNENNGRGQGGKDDRAC